VFSRDGRDVLRTQALGDDDARWFVERGFSAVQSLVMLRHDHVGLAPSGDDALAPWTWRRLRSRRHAQVADAVLAVDAESFAPPWNMTRDAFAAACHATSDHVVFVDSRAGHPVAGFVLAGRSATNAYLQRLAVHPQARRRGIARNLARAALAWAQRNGATSSYVNTEPDNQPALALYASLGFVTNAQRLTVLERPAAAVPGGRGRR
jgi:ribosomal-protein-alanine N-acetyltransferase